MKLVQLLYRVGRWLVFLILPIALLALIGFFLVGTYTGEYGQLAFDSAEARRSAAASVVDKLEQEAFAREARNRGLRDGSINLDLLDERARSELGLIRDDEVFLLESPASAQ